MKTWIIKLSVSVFVILLSAGYWMYGWLTRTCALCDSAPFHGLCLVDLEAGEVYALTVYDPDPFRPGELSDLQTVGTFSFLRMGELTGCQNTARHSADVSVPAEAGFCWSRHFCFDCWKLLRNNSGVRYMIADLYEPESPVVFPIIDGAVYRARCYEATITADPEKKELDILVLGDLDLSGYATSQTGLPTS